MEGKVSPFRSMFYVQTALEGVTAPSSLSYVYLIESIWSHKQTNSEFATFTLETHGQESPMLPEAILNPDVPQAEKVDLLMTIDRIYEAQVRAPVRGGERRVYRVLATRSGGPYGQLACEHLPLYVERTFTLKPLFDINEAGNAVPCKLKLGT